MKITEIRTLISWAGLRNWVVVKVLTDTEIYGWGEATLEGKEPTVEAAVHQLGEQLIGHDPLAVEHHWQVLYRHGFWRGGVVLNSALAALDHCRRLTWQLQRIAPPYRLRRIATPSDKAVQAIPLPFVLFRVATCFRDKSELPRSCTSPQKIYSRTP